MLWASAGEDVTIQNHILQGCIIHAVEIRTGKHLISILQSDLLANRSGGFGVIARNHLHTNSCAMAFRHGCNRLGTRWVDHPHHPNKRECAFHFSLL